MKLYLVSKARGGNSVGWLKTDDNADAWGLATIHFPRLRNPDVQHFASFDWQEVGESGLPVIDCRTPRREVAT